MRTCLYCRKQLTTRHQIVFCSNKCQNDKEYKVFLIKWRLGVVCGGIGITTKAISGHVKRYLIEKYGAKCWECGWDKKHPITGKVPLEIDHIDGNSENNRQSNLRILCPNCHSLTTNFKNLNKGKGRLWRKIKYTKNI